MQTLGFLKPRGSLVRLALQDRRLPWEGGLPQRGCKTSEMGAAARGKA